MKKTILSNCRALRLLAAALLLLMASVSANAYDFEEENDDGVTIYYNILNEEDKTAEVTYLYYNSSSNSEAYSGAVSIPETATYNGSTYTVTEIGDYAFYQCAGLTSITIPESVTSIGERAFWYCTGLTSVTIPNSVTVIGDYAFQSCAGLTSVTIGNSVTVISDYAFLSCAGLTKFEVAEGNEYYCAVDGVLYAKDMTTLVAFPPASTLLPSFEIPNSVTMIDRYAFYDCSGLTSVTIPNSVTEIGRYAFCGCSGLTSELTIPESVTEIGNSAFINCSGLTQVTIGSGVTTIGQQAFEGCEKLTEVNFNATACSSAGNYFGAFYACTNISTFNFGDNVTIIPSFLCSLCSGLTQITIPNSVTEIGYGAFDECMGLTKFEVAEGNGYYCAVDGVLYSKGMTTLVEFPLASSLLPSFDIPEGVTEIGDYAFDNCSGLTSVTIPESVTTIGDYAFYDCWYLTCELTIPNRVTTIGDYAFYQCNIKGTLTIPNSVTEIGRYAFWRCQRLTQVNIGNSVTEIGDDAFSSCHGLTSVNIGNSVGTIGSRAFSGCVGLTSIYSLNPEPPTCEQDNVFDNVDTSTCVLYVPTGSKEAYSSAYVWEDFLNIEEMDMTPVSDITADGNAEAVGYYTTDGKQVPKPQRGINIIRYSDGMARKVLVK